MQEAYAILNTMKKWAHPPLSQVGFTIVETLIVLAVTSGLFVISAVVIQGKQSKTNFQIGSRAMQQQLQQVINETASGYYPNTSGLSCDPMASPTVNVTTGTDAQGQSSGCIFAGKVIVFSASEKEYYKVYSLAGRRLNGGVDVTSAKDAHIAAIPDSVETIKIPNGLEFYGGKTSPSGPTWSTTRFAYMYLPSFATYSSGSGAQQLELRNFNTNWNNSDPIVNRINNEATLFTAYPVATNGVLICLQNSGTNQSVLYTLTNGLEVRAEIKSGMTCS